MKGLIVHQILDRTVQTFPNQVVVSGNTRLTYSQFYERVLRLAWSLYQQGVEKGTVAGVLDVNTHRYLELHYALSMLGAVVHTINFRLPAEDLVYTMAHAGDEWVFVSDVFLPSVRPLAAKFPNWVLLSDDPHISLPEAKRAFRYEELVASGRPERRPQADQVGEMVPFSIFYTTGTTGKPKGIQYRQREITLGALQLFHHLALHITGAKVDSRDVFMPLIPFFHIHGWGTALFVPYLGAKLVLPGKANPAEQVELIQKEGVTWLNMVPTQLHLLLETPGFGKVKVLTGGSPLPTGLARRSDQAGVRFSVIYGGSDQLGTTISVVPEGAEPESEEAREILRTRMLPFPMVDVSIRNKEGNEVPHDGNSIGEIWVRSPWLPAGYYKDPERSRESYSEGWFRSGDLGVLHPNGLLSVVDREKDAVKSGGEWIVTSVVEALLSEHPGVGLAAVIARLDEQWSERPLAVVKPARPVTEQELRQFLEEKAAQGKIARFWIPDAFVFVEELPLTSAGKVNKVALRQKYGAAAERK